MAKTIDTPSAEYNAQAVAWRLIHDLLGGTRRMRDAGETWLPREEKEPQLKYEARLKRSILYNGLRDTVRKISARPFAQPIQTDQPDVDNIDRQGSDLTTFAQQLLRSAITRGRAHVFVDYPSQVGSTLADEKSAYFTLIHANQLIDWDEEVVDNARRLSRIVVKEDPSRIRVVTDTEWEVWELKEKTWVLTESGTHTFGRVPIVTLQLSEGFMSAEPLFEDLAWLNLAHWQSYSDHRNILRVARVPLLARVGFTQDELKEPVILGPTNVLSSTHPDAKVFYVEHSGKAIEAGMKDLERLEKQMEALGMQPLVATVERTAQEVRTDNDRSMSEAQLWVIELGNSLTEALRVRAEWRNQTIEPEVSVFMDFNMNSADADMLLRAAAAGQISRSLFLTEWQRRGILDENLNIEEEVGTDIE